MGLSRGGYRLGHCIGLLRRIRLSNNVALTETVAASLPGANSRWKSYALLTPPDLNPIRVMTPNMDIFYGTDTSGRSLLKLFSRR